MRIVKQPLLPPRLRLQRSRRARTEQITPELTAAAEKKASGFLSHYHSYSDHSRSFEKNTGPGMRRTAMRQRSLNEWARSGCPAGHCQWLGTDPSLRRL